MSLRKLVVISAGLSQPSSTRLLADRLATATQGALEDLGASVSVELVELRDVAHDVTNAALIGFPSPQLADVIRSTLTADGLIAVTPIFNASYSGLFKSFFDVIDADVLDGRPVLIAATGGTERHSLALEHALRPLFSYLKAVVVPTSVYAASSDWGTVGADHLGLARRIERAASELADQMLRQRREGGRDRFSDAVPFETLLVGD